MSYLSVPELVALVWMACVLRKIGLIEGGQMLTLWMVGLLLIVVEGIARIVYLSPTSLAIHRSMHIVTLDTYFLAGAAFFRSVIGRLRLRTRDDIYLACSVAPHVLLLSVYGWESSRLGTYLTVAGLGVLASCATASVFGRQQTQIVANLLIWVTIVCILLTRDYRSAAYFSLFVAYAATALAFRFGLPQERRGRSVVIAGFAVWSVCFLTHPWIAQTHRGWRPLIERVWDLQKFFVTFGLLIVSLDQESSSREHRALHDALTGLPNRRLFQDRLGQALALAKRTHTRAVLFNIDLNDFKAVNDHLGHDAGDKLLQEVSRRMDAFVRHSDTIARIGGDEFNVIVSNFRVPNEGSPTAPTLHEGVRWLSGKLRDSVESNLYTVEIDGVQHRIRPSLSIGYAVYPIDANDQERLCQLADQRMYEDKRVKRARLPTANRRFAVSRANESEIGVG